MALDTEACEGASAIEGVAPPRVLSFNTTASLPPASCVLACAGNCAKGNCALLLSCANFPAALKVNR